MKWLIGFIALLIMALASLGARGCSDPQACQKRCFSEQHECLKRCETPGRAYEPSCVEECANLYGEQCIERCGS